MKRLDLYLVECNLVANRSRARERIEAGEVFWRPPQGETQLLSKAGLNVEPLLAAGGEVFVAKDLAFVSRAGEKLAGALEDLALSVHDQWCLDVGQSTGGFTDCLLQQGAAKVFGIDVGHSQLHPRLQQDPRVTFFEKTHVQDLNLEMFRESLAEKEGFDFLVADLSFISVLPYLSLFYSLLRPGGRALILIKPQFELGVGAVNKKGLVRDSSLYDNLAEKVKMEAQRQMPLDVAENISYFESKVAGREGNREFFLFLSKAALRD